MKRVAAVVPAFNESQNIAAVVEGLLALPLAPEVIVVDDGSQDDTGERARRAGAIVLSMPFNSGIGGGVQTGMLCALERGCEAVVRIDGDGQHDPRDLPRLLDLLERDEADFVLGSRYLERAGRQTTAIRRLGIHWFSILLRLVCGLRVNDPTSGFWAANRRAARLLAQEYASDYPEVDSLVYLSRAGCRLSEVPVVMHPRAGGDSSIKGAAALYYMIKVTVALLVGRLRPSEVREG